MFFKLRSHLSYGNVVATLALFVALGGTAAASVIVSSNNQVARSTISGHKPPSGDHPNIIAGSVSGKDLGSGVVSSAKLGAGSVTSSKLHSNAVSSANVLDNSLTGADIKDNSLTGADVNSSTLGTVPEATALTGCPDGVQCWAPAHEVQIGESRLDPTQAGVSQDFFTRGPLTFTMKCTDEGSGTYQVDLYAASAGDNVYLGFSGSTVFVSANDVPVLLETLNGSSAIVRSAAYTFVPIAGNQFDGVFGFAVDIGADHACSASATAVGAGAYG